MTARTDPAIQALQGTWRSDRQREREGELLPRVTTRAPDPPPWLTDDVSRSEFMRVATELHACGVLREVSVEMLAQYAKLHAAIRATYEAGRVPAATYISTLRALAASLSIVRAPTARLTDPRPVANRFAKFRKRP